MIGLDTNVLVRYLVVDDIDQCRRAAELIEAQCTDDSPGRICIPVLCELVWVLDRGYGFDRSAIIDVVRRLLAVDRLTIEKADIARQALHAFEKETPISLIT